MKYLKHIVIILMLFSIISCDNYLNLTNPNNLSKDAIGQSESDLSLLLNGCYDAAQNNFNNAYRFLDCFSEVGYGEVGITEGGGTPQSDTYLNYWKRSYLLIVRCNELLATISAIDSPNAQVITIESEAKFLRALGYFYLTVLYKDAPLIVNRQSFDDRFIAINSQSEIKDQIISDLDYAALHLPANQVYPKATKGAALALESRVYLYFGQWDKVIQLTQDIIDLHKYSLYADYAKLFTEAAENNNESIFAIAYASGMGEGESFSGSWPKQPYQMGIRPLSNYANSFYCTDGLSILKSPLYSTVEFYKNRDPRYEVSILRKGEIVSNGLPYEPGTSVTGYSIQKYVRNTTLYQTDGPQDFMVLRFADVILMRAEALIESNQLNQEVYQLIDQVRSRVGMPKVEDIEGNNLSQADLREVLRHERLVELGEEGGLRWIDIKRWNIVEQIYNSITFHKRPYLGEKTLYWPIPQVEIDNNPSLKQQDWWK